MFASAWLGKICPTSRRKHRCAPITSPSSRPTRDSVGHRAIRDGHPLPLAFPLSVRSSRRDSDPATPPMGACSGAHLHKRRSNRESANPSSASPLQNITSAIVPCRCTYITPRQVASVDGRDLVNRHRPRHTLVANIRSVQLLIRQSPRGPSMRHMSDK